VVDRGRRRDTFAVLAGGTTTSARAANPSRLAQDVEHVAVLIHGAPQELLPTIDRHEQLVEMPGVAESTTPLPETGTYARPNV